MSDAQQLYLSLLSEDADPEEIATLTRRLRRELLEIDIEDAAFAQGTDLPEGAKSLGAIDWNTLILTFVSSSGVLTSLIVVLNSWVQRNRTTVQVVLANGAQVTFEGNLKRGSEAFQQVMDILESSNTQPQADPTFATDPALATLRQKMNDHLKLEEVKSIYFDLLLDYEQFGGETLNKDGKIQLLIKYCHRNGRLPDLRQYCAAINSSISWEV